MKKQNEEQRRQNEELERQSKELERHNIEIERQNSLNRMDEETEISNNSEIKIQQFNMSKDNAVTYVDRGMMYLEDENTEKAIEFFEMALDINPHLATAHLGKFLANYNILSLDDLQNYEQGKEQNYLAAVHALCQTVIKEIEYLNHRHIGLMVFLRRDIAEEAIQSNFRQFIDQYSRYELNWSQTEALRLALWVAKKAIPELETEGKILLLSREEIEKRLELLWGKKLGKDTSKEANSARWILAALSDFNGQLQARDIVRFLKYASQDSKSVSLLLKDRYIMPKKIRDAIEPCAKDKLEEMKQEMPKIYNILQKFNDKRITVRQLPLELEKISLSVDELDRLERQGFIKVSEKQYYLPEIIRRALGYRYKVGARPKVLSLLIK